MNVVTPRLIGQILGVTDELGLHREAVVIPLDTTTDGELRLDDGVRLTVIVPEEGDLEEWLEQLPDRISALDLSRVPRSEE